MAHNPQSRSSFQLRLSSSVDWGDVSPSFFAAYDDYIDHLNRIEEKLDALKDIVRDLDTAYDIDGNPVTSIAELVDEISDMMY